MDIDAAAPLTLEQSFLAMCFFLRRYDDRGQGNDRIVDVISSTSCNVWADGSPNDPAMARDWADAVAQVRSADAVGSGIRASSGRADAEGPALIGSQQAYDAMNAFLEGKFDAGIGDTKLLDLVEALESFLAGDGGDGAAQFEQWSGRICGVVGLSGD